MSSNIWFSNPFRDVSSETSRGDFRKIAASLRTRADQDQRVLSGIARARLIAEIGGGRKNRCEGSREFRLASVSATTTAATATPAATESAAALFARPGFVDRQRTAILLRFVQSFDSVLGRVVVGHFHESKTLASARVTILNHFGLRTEPYCANIDSRLELSTS